MKKKFSPCWNLTKGCWQSLKRKSTTTNPDSTKKASNQSHKSPKTTVKPWTNWCNPYKRQETNLQQEVRRELHTCRKSKTSTPTMLKIIKFTNTCTKWKIWRGLKDMSVMIETLQSSVIKVAFLKNERRRRRRAIRLIMGVWRTKTSTNKYQLTFFPDHRPRQNHSSSTTYSTVTWAILTLRRKRLPNNNTRKSKRRSPKRSIAKKRRWESVRKRTTIFWSRRLTNLTSFRRRWRSTRSRSLMRFRVKLSCRRR